jgi:hypothetical protein
MALESWRNNQPDPGGEYLAAAFLNDGSIAVVVPIQNDANRRLGFGWRRFAVPGKRVRGATSRGAFATSKRSLAQ